MKILQTENIANNIYNKTTTFSSVTYILSLKRRPQTRGLLLLPLYDIKLTQIIFQIIFNKSLNLSM